LKERWQAETLRDGIAHKDTRKLIIEISRATLIDRDERNPPFNQSTPCRRTLFTPSFGFLSSSSLLGLSPSFALEFGSSCRYERASDARRATTSERRLLASSTLPWLLQGPRSFSDKFTSSSFLVFFSFLFCYLFLAKTHSPSKPSSHSSSKSPPSSRSSSRGTCPRKQTGAFRSTERIHDSDSGFGFYRVRNDIVAPPAKPHPRSVCFSFVWLCCVYPYRPRDLGNAIMNCQESFPSPM